MERPRPSIRFPRPWTVILVMLLPGPIIMLLQRGAERLQSKDQRVRADVTTIRAALDSYAMEHVGNYPDSLDVLFAMDERGHRYLDHSAIPKDPWNAQYHYEPPSPGYPQPRIYTLGADGKPGGTGDDADIDYESIVNRR